MNKLPKNKFIFVGYNHSIGDGFLYFLNLLKKIQKNSINHISINWKEGWTGILNAHFWLTNEFSSYLGRLSDGGGSLHEHSHGIHFLVCLEKIFKFRLKNEFNSFLNIKMNLNTVMKIPENIMTTISKNILQKSRKNA